MTAETAGSIFRTRLTYLLLTAGVLVVADAIKPAVEAGKTCNPSFFRSKALISRMALSLRWQSEPQ